MKTVRITTDADSEGVEIEVEPFGDGGWACAHPGFLGVRPGPATKVYVDGGVHWAQRRWDSLVLIPE